MDVEAQAFRPPLLLPQVCYQGAETAVKQQRTQPGDHMGWQQHTAFNMLSHSSGPCVSGSINGAREEVAQIGLGAFNSVHK